MFDDLVKSSIQVDPFRGETVTHARNAGNVVGRFSAKRGQIRVLLRCDVVFLLHCLGGHMLQVFEMMPRIENCDVVVDQLECVAVSGEHQRAVSGLVAHRGQRSDHIIAFITWFFDEGDTQCGKHLLDQRQLGEQFLRRGIAGSLVLRQHLAAERSALNVERDGEMIRLFGIDHL